MKQNPLLSLLIQMCQIKKKPARGPVQVYSPPDTTPGIPFLIASVDGKVFYQSDEIILSWTSTANASEYIVQISGPPGVDGILSAWQPYTSIDFRDIVGGNLSGWNYYWAVKSCNADGVESDWSSWRSFSIEADPIPEAPSRIAKISDQVKYVFIRKTPGVVGKDNTTDTVVTIRSGELVEILGGPEYVDGLQWWYVTWKVYEGWIAEKTRSGLLILIFNP